VNAKLLRKNVNITGVVISDVNAMLLLIVKLENQNPGNFNTRTVERVSDRASQVIKQFQNVTQYNGRKVQDHTGKNATAPIQQLASLIPSGKCNTL
jgi:hypothetical protein